MGTRKNDFVDNFWIRDAIERRSLPQKKDIIQNYKNLQTVDTNQLNESVYQKADLLFKKTLSKQITEEKKSVGSKDWEIVSTPYGLFYFNKTTNQWMNSFGIVSETFEKLMELTQTMFSFQSQDGDSKKIRISPIYENNLSLLRVVDSDIYGFIVERNHDSFSIDNYYPEYPYTRDRSLNNFGDIYEFLNVMENIQTWDSELSGRAFMGGALGKRLDIAGATSYGEPGSTERAWSQNWAKLNSANGLASFYDVGDSARRGINSREIKPSTFSKYQWFDFLQNEVKGSLKISIAAGYGGSVQIDKDTEKINVPRTGYTSIPGQSSAIYDIIITNPTPTQIESANPYLVELNGAGTKIAKIRELFSNDLDGDGVVDVPENEQIKFVSIDSSVDQVLATLDTNGSIRLVYNYDTSAEGLISTGNAWQFLAYFDKDWIGNGFLTDDTGEPVFIENKDFVSVTVSGGLGSFIYVWCLHKSGKLYGVELVTASELAVDKNKKREKFIISGQPSSGRNLNFGKPNNPTGFNQNTPDEFRIYYNWQNDLPVSAVDNGLCKEIAYVLNLIPKVNNIRFPVTSVWGGYHTGGILTCIDPTYTGYFPSTADEFKHPTQMCEIVKLQKIRTFSENVVRLLNKIQRYTATYNSNTNTWSYSGNTNCDQNMYDTIFGVTLNVNGVNQLVYVPPRCVSIQRLARNATSSSPNTNADGIVNILSNNGTFTVIAGNETYVPSIFDVSINPNYLQEMTQYNKLTMRGDFTLSGNSWDYDRYGASALFNYDSGSAPDATRYKYGNGPNLLNPNLVVPPITFEEYDPSIHWKSFFTQANIPMGWGNPPPGITTAWIPQYNIPEEGTNALNVFGFSIFDYLGNTAMEARPNYAFKEGNYITNQQVVKVVCYGDTAGNLPIYSNQSINSNYNFFGNTIPVLGIANEEILENAFAWVRGVGDITYGIKFDGTIDLISHRAADLDGFIFDPFWGPCYPTDRLNPSGITFSNLKPANYNDKLDTLKKVGVYVEGNYTSYNYYLPDVYGTN
jgi:hypothetical protein